MLSTPLVKGRDSDHVWKTSRHQNNLGDVHELWVYF